MKRFTLILSLMVAMVTTAMAQVPAGGDSYSYYILNARNNAYYVTTTAAEQANNGNLGSAQTFSTEKAKMVFKIYENGAYYKLKSSSYFIRYDNTTEGAGKVKTGTQDSNNVWTIVYSAGDNNPGLSINAGENGSQSWNMYGGVGANIGLFTKTDGGSTWFFVPADETTYNKMVSDANAWSSYAGSENYKVVANETIQNALTSIYNEYKEKTYSEENAVALAKALQVLQVDDYLKKINLTTGYYVMKNVATGRREYLFNDYTRVANSNNQTLQSEAPETVTNNYIWHVTNNGNGTITVKNGQGTFLKADNLITYETLTFAKYNGQEGIYFYEALNCSNGGQKISDNTHCLTTWSNGGPTASDNRWNFVEQEGTVYNVEILKPEKVTATVYVTKGENEIALDGGFFMAQDLQTSDLTASAVDGCDVALSVEGNTITATYTYRNDFLTAYADEMQTYVNSKTPTGENGTALLGQCNQDIINEALTYCETLRNNPTEANYNALVDHITVFNKSHNMPVYIIRSAHDGYAAGSAILYNGSSWRWDTTNKYNKQMWMTIPANKQTAVPAVEAYDANGTSYEICDYLTGTVMRDKSVQIVAIEGLENAYNLQYNANANSTDAAQHAKDTKELVNWKPATATDALASAWYIDYIGNSYELDLFTDEKIEAVVAMENAYNAKAFYADAEIGDGLGKYTGSKDAVVAALPAAEEIIAMNLVEQAKLDVSTINEATTALNEAEVPQINLPVEGKYYRIKGACDATPANYYITCNTNADEGRIACKADADASTIFFYNDDKLLAYNSGLYIGVNGSNYKFSSIDGTTPATEITFAGSPRQAGAYTVKSADRFLFYKVYNGEVEIDRSQDNNSANLDWTLEEVTELPVAVTAAGYATLYAPVALTVPSEEVKAYTVTINGEWATLNEITSGIIPANTGVVIAGANGEAATADTYNFAITTTEDTATSALLGSVATTYYTEAGTYYALAQVDGVVGFYKDQFNNSRFQNNSHKAYLYVASEGAEAASYSFRFGEGTTGVDQITDNREQSTVIYDLTGRRVENPSNGIYIINGVKVLVK